jgi:hypothetical protein
MVILVDINITIFDKWRINGYKLEVEIITLKKHIFNGKYLNQNSKRLNIEDNSYLNER